MALVYEKNDKTKNVKIQVIKNRLGHDYGGNDIIFY